MKTAIPLSFVLMIGVVLGGLTQHYLDLHQIDEQAKQCEANIRAVEDDAVSKIHALQEETDKK